MQYIEIERLWTDSDGMLQVKLAASNGSQTAQQDFYVYPDELEELAEKMSQFASQKGDGVTFEYGKRGEFYALVRLRAVMLDAVGHSAFEVTFDNNQKGSERAEAHFFMKCDPATINEFGKSLKSWVEQPDAPYRLEWNA